MVLPKMLLSSVVIDAMFLLGSFILALVPVSANTSSGKQDVNAGSNFHLKCNVSGDPRPRVTWYKDSNPIEYTDGITVSGEPPVISDETSTEEISQEGSYATFNCITRGRPTPTVSWHRDGIVLQVNATGGGRYRLLENGTLQVIGLEKSDAGTYTCMASNGIEPDARRDYKLTVHELIHPNCTDSPFLNNCKLIVKYKHCFHKFYAKFCCKSCTEAGQLPVDGSRGP